MRAAVLHGFGETPRYEEFATPIPTDDETLVRVTAAAVNYIDRMQAAGKHYSSDPEALPAIPGLVGVGRLEDGSRVTFAAPRAPYGAIAELVVVPRRMCAPFPDELDDVTAAALYNPGVSQWLALQQRAGVRPGETVLVLGATGISGGLAVQIAKLLGAGRVVAAGRDPRRLEQLRTLGADETIRIDQVADLPQAFADAAGESGYDVVLDYLWGAPAEALFAALTRGDLIPTQSNRTRHVQIGTMAGSDVTLPAAVLRSSGLELMGSGSGTMPSQDVMNAAYTEVMERAAAGQLILDTEVAPLAEVETAWNRETRHRLVLQP